MKKKIKVLMLDNMSDALVHYLNELTASTITVPKDRQPADYEILIAGKLDEDILTKNQGLVASIIPWSGIPESYEQLLSEERFAHIKIHNCHYHYAIVAEYAFGMMLAIAKDLRRKDYHLRQGDWRLRFSPTRTFMLSGKTVLIMGYGAIGREIGRLCSALGLRVIGTQRSVTEPTEIDHALVYPSDQLNELLPQSDVLVNALPLTPETENLIDAEALGRLKSSAIIVNIGRAHTFDQEALYNALANNQIHGAALDVWYNYPQNKLERIATFPADYPFHQLDNVLLSPHNSASLVDNEHLDVRMEALAQMLNRYAETGELPNPVDSERGY